jgi:type IV pilus assembly protein PilQ
MKSIMKKSVFIVSFLVILIGQSFTSAQLFAQDGAPFREYVNPDEIVMFDRNTSFVEALEIINQFMQEYENKFLVDQSNYEGEIGVSLPAMHWKDALKYILKVRNLELVEFPEYYEVRVPVQTNNNNVVAQEGTNAAQNNTPLNQLASTKTREVRINATFFEGNRRALQEIGIDWSTLTSNVPENIDDFVGSDGGESIPQTTFSDQFVSINSQNANQVSQNVFNALVNLGEIGPGISVQALFSTFESNNMGSVIATPSVKVVDGQEGKIQDGQDFSVKQRDFAGNVTDAFFSTGTILTVTPTVIEYNDSTFIHLDIQAERSSAQPDAVSTIINKQQVTTQTLVLDGEATAIAGLYRTSEVRVRRGIPFLKDLPGWFLGLKYLFGYNSTDIIENELVIIIQAELEKTLQERMDDKIRSKGNVLSDERNRFRNEMDYVIDKEEETPVTLVDDKAGLIEAEDSVVTEEEEMVPVQKEEQPKKEEKLTPEQQRELEDLSMPIKDPELMVVVPQAFDLNEYLHKKENGELTVEEVSVESNAKYFVIGGSFIVPNNATNFEKVLENQGYTPRILFHESSRFNYVAYYAFDNYEEAVATTKKLRAEINPETWLFTLPNK